MAKVTEKAPENKGLGWLKVIFSVAAALLLFSIGFAAAVIYDRWIQPSDPNVLTIIIYRYDTQNKAPTQSTNIARPSYMITYYEFPEPFTINLSNSPRLLQAKVALSTSYDASMIEYVRMHRLAMRSDILSVLGASTLRDVQSENGKREIQRQIRDAANKVLEKHGIWPGIEDAHLTSLYVQ